MESRRGKTGAADAVDEARMSSFHPRRQRRGSPEARSTRPRAVCDRLLACVYEIVTNLRNRGEGKGSHMSGLCTRHCKLPTWGRENPRVGPPVISLHWGEPVRPPSVLAAEKGQRPRATD